MDKKLNEYAIDLCGQYIDEKELNHLRKIGEKEWLKERLEAGQIEIMECQLVEGETDEDPLYIDCKNESSNWATKKEV